jgi:hypothetical protein
MSGPTAGPKAAVARSCNPEPSEWIARVNGLRGRGTLLGDIFLLDSDISSNHTFVLSWYVFRNEQKKT